MVEVEEAATHSRYHRRFGPHSRRVWPTLIIRIPIVSIIAVVFVNAFSGEELAGSAWLTLLAGACALAGSFIVLADRCVPGEKRSPIWLSAWPAVLSCAAMIAATAGMDDRVLPLALGCGLLVATVGAANEVIRRLGADGPAAACAVFSLAAGATTAPLWLGPLAELSQSTAIVNTALAVSPLTLLSVAADFDYLRTGWFYQHSALGALRYEYPSLWILLPCYALPSLALFVAAANRINRQRWFSNRFTTPTPKE